MALDFAREAGPQIQLTLDPSAQNTNTVENDLEAFEEYDINADRAKLSAELTGSQEVDGLVSRIEVYDMNSIVTFGAEAAAEISKASDSILNSVSKTRVDDSGELLKALAKIMDQFNIDEIREPSGVFGKLFGNFRKQLDKILEKYHTMGSEVDKIYVELRKYEADIRQTNRNLARMFDTNVEYYHTLVKYILAGEQACKEIQAYIDQRQADLDRTGDQSIQFDLTSLKQALQMMEQRTHDLRLAEMVAMQSIPMIKMMEYNNYNLIRKINSAFIVTLPVFKQALAQAIMLKRQRVQSESLAELNKKTNEMLVRNAQNAAASARDAARQGNMGTAQIEALQNAWKSIQNGITETKTLQTQSKQKQNEDQARLERIKQDFNRQYHVPSEIN